MNEITRLTAAALAARIREGRLTPADVVDAYLARITAVDPVVAAYVRVLAERARARARALDTETRAGARGPLHGVPVAIKDLIAIAGVPMTAGSSFLGVEPEPETATVVRRLEAAGAIVLGTTVLNEFALGTTGVNPHSRTPRNPWNLDRIVGGSSSGSGAAVASRLAAAAIGTDTGGSIRIPAALCGIVGLKPTFGRISRHGVLPLAGSFDTVGPMVRTVEDAALMLEVMAGADPADPHCSLTPAGRYLEEMRRDPRGLHVARLSGSFFEDDLDPAAVHALDAATRALQRAGLRIRAVMLRTIEAGHDAQLAILRAEAAVFHRATFPGREADYNPDVRAILEQGASISPAALDEARVALRELQAEIAAVLHDCPVLLAPAVPVGAARIADADPRGPHWPEIRRQLGRFTRLFNAVGLPTLVLPAGLTAERLPIALQLAAPPFEEGMLLSVAHRLEQAIGWSLPDLPREEVTR